MIILTEKPSVARDIARALNYKSSEGYWVSESGRDCIVAAHGHLLESYLPDDYDPKWKSWKTSFQDLPIVPETFKYKIKDNCSETLKKIERCFRNFDSREFILATDAEREGEVIGAEILEYVEFAYYTTAKRFWVSEALTPEVVRKGIANAQPLSNYDSYKKAGFARAEADWLVGMNISRVLTVQANKLLSFGRVQTAILGAIYLRDRNIANFIPKDYFQLIVTLTKNNQNFNVIFTKDNNDRFDDDINLKIVQGNLGEKLLIQSITREDKTENVPQLFNITGLQKYCSNKFHLTPDETLKIAQSLYETHKCLSYPRTPSVVLGDDNVELFRQKYELLSKVNPKLASRCDVNKISNTNKRLFNSANLTDHHALIPLNVLPENVSENERNVYNAVLLRFFQTIMNPCKYQVLTLDALQDNYHFIGKGRTYIDKGWKENFEEEQDEETEVFPNDIEKGDLLKIVKSETVAKKTTPKKHFTDATILALMENPRDEDVEKTGKLVGLGTPATRAGIIKELIDRTYIIQKGQQLIISDLGKFLIETVIKIPALKDFISLKTTTSWEEKLTTEPDIFLSNIKSFIMNEVPKITVSEKWIENEIGKCPICHKGNISEGQKSFYCSEYQNGCKFSISKNILGAPITKSDAMLLIHGKSTKFKKMHSQKTGKDFSAKLKLKIMNGNYQFDYIFKE
ncbi:MAG: DNA topoisomerase [Treponema sp.]|uniref:type IA DNA topoisomerase n=1 Tax=Treponema sp. TaxID=166 RepID=UPI00298EBDBC|nr:DNA topoisomerase [Treponema sp.]MCQ2601106.1 DNA topoisomerase [Treponema sp.]